MTLRLVNGQIIEMGGPKPHVSFYEFAVKVGVGQYKPVDFVKIVTPGQRDYMSRPATDRDKQNYPDEWAAYQAGQQETESSDTRLDALPAYKTYFGLELKARGIETIQQLAAQESCPIDGCERLWDQAKRWILLEGDNELRSDTA